MLKRVSLLLIIVLSFCHVKGQTESYDMFPKNAEWLYYDGGNSLGGSWIYPSFDDSNWNTGSGSFGYGEGDESTLIDFGPDSDDKHIATYFRKTFFTPSVWNVPELELRMQYDDGAIVYINGSEVARVNMPTGTVNHNTEATGTVSGNNENVYEIFEISPTVLQPGTNVIAVAVHQATSYSTDMSFDAQLRVRGFAELNRKPYVQNLGSNRATLLWQTDINVNAQVYYGTDINALLGSATDYSMTRDHAVTMMGLQPNTRYYYSIGHAEGILLPADTSRYFQTSPSTGSKEPLRFWVIGDCGTGDQGQIHVMNAYNNKYPGHTHGILALGDNAYPDGAHEDYDENFFGVYHDMLDNTCVWSCVGNHELYAANSSFTVPEAPFFDVFHNPTGGEAGGVASGSEAYYSWDVGNVHFISLDSQASDRSVGGAMYTWFEMDLASTDQDWIVLFFHHPPYSFGNHNSDQESYQIIMRQNFIPLAEQYGVDMVFTGHSHSYERSRFIHGHYGYSSTFNSNTMVVQSGRGMEDVDCGYEKSLTGPEEGTLYVVTGSAGKVSNSALGQHPVHLEQELSLGSMVLEVEDNRADLKFINELGVVIDYMTVHKDVGHQESFTIAPGQSLTLSASWVGEYDWSGGNGSNRSITVSPNSSVTYVVTDPYSCIQDQYIVTVNSNGNYAPVVTIESPNNDAQFNQGDVVNIEISASDSDGSVASVELFVDGVSVGIDPTAPYDFMYTVNASGFYTLEAVATDNQGLPATSAVVTIDVVAPIPNVIPTVDISSPSSGASVQPGDIVNFEIAASDSDGTVVSVVLSVDGSMNQSTNSSPYQFNWMAPNAPGTYSISVISIDDDGAQSLEDSIAIEVSSIPNDAPTVSIDSPSNGSTYNGGDNVNIEVSANDADGTVSSVSLYVDGQLVDTDSNSPFDFNYSVPAAAGTYEISVIAVDNDGSNSSADNIDIEVLPSAGNLPPVISIVSPADGLIVQPGDIVTFEITASDSDGFIDEVILLMGLSPLGSDQTAPYTFTWVAPNQIGTFDFYALAEDNDGLQNTTSYTTIEVVAPQATNLPPSVNITGPMSGTLAESGDQVMFSITASDIDGSVEEVELFMDGQSIGTDNSMPWEFAWTAPGTAGNYNFYVVGTDNDGDIDQSNTITITVPQPVNIPPTVSFVAPANGLTLEEGDLLSIAATASDTDGTVVSVEFFVKGISIGIDMDAPYTIDWVAPAEIGPYQLDVLATDNDGAVSGTPPVMIQVAADQLFPPVVSLNSTSNGANVAPGDLINLSVNASDPDGSVVQVDLYIDGQLVASDASNPWQFMWSAPSQSGDYEFYVVAIDNDDLTSASTVLTITVDAPVNIPPLVAFVAPNNNDVFEPGETVTFTVSAGDMDGTIDGVDFYVDGILLGSDSSMPYQFTWSTPAQEGSYVVTAVATDDDGDTTISSALNIEIESPVNQLPLVNVIAPSSGLVLDPDDVLNFLVAASDVDGQIVSVELFANGVLVGTDNIAPYEFIWVAPEVAGDVFFTVVATDNDGGTTTTDPIITNIESQVNTAPSVIIVSPSASAISALTGETLNFTISATDADGWVVSSSLFINGQLVSTDSNAPYQFSWTAPNSAGTYVVSAMAEDNEGAQSFSSNVIVTVTLPINDVPVVSIASPNSGYSMEPGETVSFSINASDADGNITSVSLMQAGQVIGTDGSAPYSFAWTAPSNGIYQFQASATDNDGAQTTSSIISIVVETIVPPNDPPTVTIVSPSSGTEVNSGSTVAINVQASDEDGIQQVQLFVNGFLAVSDFSAPYNFNWTAPNALGQYNVVAVATDNLGGVTTSNSIVLNVVATPVNQAPMVTIYDPVDGLVVESGDLVSLSVSAGDVDGSVAMVRLYQGASMMGQDNTQPYNFQWMAPSPGVYSFKAEAMDDDGATTLSAPITITVQEPVGPPTSMIEIAYTLDGSSFDLGTMIDVVTTANGNFENITSVKWFANGINFAVDYDSELEAFWTPMEPGTYMIFAIAHTTDGGYFFSNQITVNITGDNQAPTVEITAPATGTSYETTQTVSIHANAVDADGFVSVVTFLVDGVQIGTDATAPYIQNWTPTAAGTYELQAIAMDDENQSTSSQTVIIEVGVGLNQAPEIIITSPLAFEEFFDLNPITLSADASDFDGSINKVLFYAGGSFAGSDYSEPFDITWTPPGLGTFSVWAIAIDDDGEAMASEGITIVVSSGVGKPATDGPYINAMQRDLYEIERILLPDNDDPRYMEVLEEVETKKTVLGKKYGLDLELEAAVKAEWTVYPNPSSDFVLIEVTNLEAAQVAAEIVLINSWGSVVDFKKTTIVRGSQIRFDLSQVPQGEYMVVLRAGKSLPLVRMVTKID